MTKSNILSCNIAEAANLSLDPIIKPAMILGGDNDLPLSEEEMDELTDREESIDDKHALCNVRARYFHPKTNQCLVKGINSAHNKRNCKALGMPSDKEEIKVETEKNENVKKTIKWIVLQKLTLNLDNKTKATQLNKACSLEV